MQLLSIIDDWLNNSTLPVVSSLERMQLVAQKMGIALHIHQQGNTPGTESMQ